MNNIKFDYNLFILKDMQKLQLVKMDKLFSQYNGIKITLHYFHKRVSP